MRKFINELIRTAKQEIKSYLPEEKECGAGMIHIRMTGKAKPVLEEFEQIRADILERLFAGVTEEERSCLKRVMGKIMKNIQAEQEDGT